LSLVGSEMAKLWKELLGLIVIFVGIGLFLYGSNSYNAAVGYTGLILLLAGIAAEIIFEVQGYLRKSGS
jgi:hypothetical protein